MTDLFSARYMLVTLGCFRNEVESDNLRTSLQELGLRETGSMESTDIIMVMTCGFIREACDEGIDTLLELTDIASGLPDRPPLLVLGCMSQRYGRELMSEMPEVDGVLGVGWRDGLRDAVEALLSGRKYMKPPGPPSMSHARREVDSEEGPSLFVRVSEGCDRACAFCAIPSIRGGHVSRPPGEVLEEIERIAGGRHREIILLAQDLTCYGSDLEAGIDLPGLLTDVARLEAAHWVRMLYLQPEGVTDRLISAVAEEPAVCDYFDIPFQHASDRVLKSMGRPGSLAEHLDLTARIRSALPGATLRSTVIVGYPGETEKDFDQLQSFVEEVEFDWLGAFIFSPEEGTRAASAGPPVPADVALSRYNRIVELQDRIEARRAESFVGRQFEVAVEGACELGPYDFIGRSYREAPVVDGVIYLTRARDTRDTVPGDFVHAVITGHEGLDLVGEIDLSQAEPGGE